MTYTTIKSLFTAICDAIRAKTGSAAAINHQDIPAAIAAIETSGGITDIIARSITELRDDSILTVGSYGLAYCSDLQEVDLPSCTTLNTYAFASIGASARRANINLSAVKQIVSSSCFKGAYINRLNLGAVTKIGIASVENFTCKTLLMPRLSNLAQNLSMIKELKLIDLGVVSDLSTISNAAFTASVVMLRNSGGVATLSSLNTFLNQAAIKSGTGAILVPRDLITTYQAATNWVTLYEAGTQFLAVEDYTVDGTLTGAADEDKIYADLIDAE